jgi:hypothetical protein
MNSVEAGRFRPRAEVLEERALPSSYALTPVVPEIDASEAARLESVLQAGLRQGDRLNVFARAGDSITISNEFLTPLATPSAGTDLAGDGSLDGTLDFFRSGQVGAQNSFSRTSTAAGAGWTSAEVLAALPGELAATRAAFVLVMAGTNDTVLGVTPEQFRQNLTRIVQAALDRGVVPVLSTIPDIPFAAVLEAKVPAFNQVVEDVGEAMQVPVWNYWRAMQRLPGSGIGADRVHPSAAPDGGGDLTETGLLYGYNVRNLTALQTLDKLRRVLMLGEPPDLPDPNVAWQPLTHALAVAAGDTTGFQVQVLDAATRRTLFSFDPFPGYTGGVRVATGDLNRDGIPDLIATVGPGGPPHVKAFDGRTGALLASFYAFDATLRSGLSVAAGDVDGDGAAEIVVSPAADAPAHVKVFSAAGQLEASFYAFAPSFVGGARLAVGDVDRDGRAEIMVAAGLGGRGNVAVFGGPGLARLASFYAFGPAYSGDVSLAAGDFDGDGAAELAVGMGPGAPPIVSVFRPLDPAPVLTFYAYSPGYRGGVGLAAVGRGRGHADLVTASGLAASPDLRADDGLSGTALDALPLYEVGFRRGASFGG